ncbi:hypothetical protein MBLNU457_g0293t2 [Dothideomycetes sp. NU457]
MVYLIGQSEGTANIARFHQYNNTKVFASAVTNQIKNATKYYGTYSETVDGHWDFTLPGIPLSLVDGAHFYYAATIFGAFSQTSWPDQSLTITSPTPFYNFPALDLNVGYQNGTECQGISHLTTKMYTYPSSLSPFSFSEMSTVSLSGTPAIVFDGDLSLFTLAPYFTSGQILSENTVLLPPLPSILAQYPAYSSQFPMVPLQSCSYISTGFGAPTVLVSASEITVPVSITSTIAGNFVPSTSSADSNSVTSEAPAVTAAASASSNDKTPTITRGTNTITLDRTLTTITNTNSDQVTVVGEFPSPLTPTHELLPTKPMSSSLAASTSAPLLVTSVSQNDDKSVQPSSTPNMGSLIAGGLSAAQAQPAVAPSTTVEASESPEVVSQGSQESQATSDTPFTAANTLRVEPSNVNNDASNNTEQGIATTHQPDSTVQGFESTGVSTSIYTPATNTAPAVLSQEAQKPQATDAIVSGNVLTTLSVPISSAGAKENSEVATSQIGITSQAEATANNIPAADSVVPGQDQATQQPEPTLAVIGGTTVSFLATPPASPSPQGVSPQSGQIQGSEVAIPVTAIVSGSVLTSWAVPVSSASPESDQTQPIQQPESNIAVVGGTTFSFLTTPLASIGSEGAFLAGEPTQQLQPVAVTALVSGSIVTSYGVPLPSTSPGLGSGQPQSYQQSESNLAVIGGTTVSFFTAPPSASEGGQVQGPQPIAITALVSGSVVTSYAVALPSGRAGDSSVVGGQAQPSSQLEATFAVIGGTTVSFLPTTPSPIAAGQTQGSQPEAITAIVGGSIVTSWAIPVSSASLGDAIGGQTQSLARAELVTTDIGGAVVTAWSLPSPAANYANDSPSYGESQLLPSAQLVTTTINGHVVTAWSIPPTQGSSGSYQGQEAAPQAELITTTISGTPVTAWSIPPNETPGASSQTPQLLQPSLITTTIGGTVVTAWSFPPASGQPQATQPAAALISAIEGVARQSSQVGASGALTETITASRENALSSGGISQSGTGATATTGTLGSSTQVRPAAASSSKSGAGQVYVSWGVLTGFCLMALVLA